MNPTGSLDFGEIVWNWATRGLMFNGMDSNRQFEYALVHQWSDMVGLAEVGEEGSGGGDVQFPYLTPSPSNPSATNKRASERLHPWWW